MYNFRMNGQTIIKEGLAWARAQLEKSCDRPQFEAELLLAHHLQKDRMYLVTHDNDVMEDPESYRHLVERRAANEPYEYIVGSASFYDLHLEVEKGVLVPRPETEILIDLVAGIIEEEKISRIAEIGVGSGAISIVLARKFPELNIVATDISEIPIKVARKNIETFGLEKQIELRRSNLIDEVDERVELVVSNPPYIAEGFLLESNVVDYEPKEALFGGRVGDELLKQIILDVKEKGIRWLACEMGYDQKEPIASFVKEIGVQSIKFYKDLVGFDRGFIIKFT
ncbi:peptide chain release factor N(5)-glutamine methyltransferase [Sulfurovum sp. NBC37-1]|uniref:peptide chain release factor N(5)-glutamine methyltransferase n=1 Tax=Sulfurovum sp. (strain NBC37-1) TaxID=387093 RepID=UPI00015876C3|nr:peptide chain release factor N(5)-glutamine methyltransferase [Sulfurovum sp. NBC37-1]BAF71566.1 protoporphyrinogen oxidase [Sulfurovum sp. NBC37-1]